MNNEERDNKIIEIHTAVMVMAEKVDNHGETLYGDGQPGLVKDVTLLQERQNECPARKATTVEGKRLTIAGIVVAIAIIALLANVGLAVLNWVDK